jgi:sugar-specific transcriptional regulator TrmB
MDMKFPAIDRLNQNKEKLKNGLNEHLRLLEEIKSDLVKMQMYKLSADYHGIEKLLEKCVTDLNNIQEITTHNN